MKFGETTRLKKDRCLNCRRVVDAATKVAQGDDPEHRPGPGDFTICLKCGHIMAFDDDLTLRALTDEEMHRVAADERILTIQKARVLAQEAKRADRHKRTKTKTRRPAHQRRRARIHS